jgi:VIT1/CCC1 family predicted Fe2+/Mn2+ transporter
MVELTPEERQKIYLEEKARLEAQEQIRKEMESKRETEQKREEEIQQMLRPKRAENFKGNILTLVGSAVLLLSLLLPWLIAYEKSSYAFRAVPFYAAVVAIICVLAVIFAFAGWYSNNNRAMGISTAIAGVIPIAISIYISSRIDEIVKSETLIDLKFHSGPGLTACTIGGIILIISGVYMALQNSEENLTDLEEYFKK